MSEASWPQRLVAGAPISWGVSEQPGWGIVLPSERVLSEMAELGLRATELGPIGYLPVEAERLRARLDGHGLRLVSGFVPLVLHEQSLDGARRTSELIGGLLAGAGAEAFVVAAVMDADWSPPVELDAGQWRRVRDHLSEIGEIVARHGLKLALHPHAGTLCETQADVERLAEDSDVGWCLDTGHLVVGGIDPVDFARDHAERIAHVHLKDVDAGLAARVRSGELSFAEAVRTGLFRPLGQGDAQIAEVVRGLERSGYERWFVLEQDTAITGEEPPVGSGPVVDVRTSVEYLDTLAPASEEVRQT